MTGFTNIFKVGIVNENMKKRWLVLLFILAGIIILYLFLVFAAVTWGNPAGHTRATTCPGYSQECTCIGIKVNEDLKYISAPPTGGESKYLCLGKVTSCKCFEEGCPISNAYKREIECTSE